MITAILTMLVAGLILGAILGFASNVFHVEVDHRVEEVTALLPGYNCGGCGYAGCAGYASAMVSGEANTVGLCKPSKPDAKQAIVDYFKDHPGPDGTVREITL